MMYPSRFLPFVIILVFLGVAASACTVRYVADYDAEVKAEILRIAKEVDLFWGRLLDTPADQRQYAKFKDDYNRIEADLRNLRMRNEIRPLNRLSTEQSQIALDLWLDDKTSHKQNNTISDFIANRHRKQFVRVFVAMARGEIAKGSEQENNN